MAGGSAQVVERLRRDGASAPLFADALDRRRFVSDAGRQHDNPGGDARFVAPLLDKVIPSTGSYRNGYGVNLDGSVRYVVGAVGLYALRPQSAN